MKLIIPFYKSRHAFYASFANMFKAWFLSSCTCWVVVCSRSCLAENSATLGGLVWFWAELPSSVSSLVAAGLFPTNSVHFQGTF